MKKIILFIILCIGLIGVAFLYLFYVQNVPGLSKNNPNSPLGIFSSSFGGGTNISENILATTTQNTDPELEKKSSFLAIDQKFLSNGETVEDAVNPGNYVLVGELGYCTANNICRASTTPEKDFSISYDKKYNQFSIILLSEPLITVRERAESFLATRLGIKKEDLCKINYYVATPYFVNEQRSGINLGFSYCSSL